MKLKLNKANLALLNFGTVIREGNKTYYFMPFWFEQTNEDPLVKVHKLGLLPNELKEIINERKDWDRE